MQEYFALLEKTPMFAGLNANQLDSMLRCLGAETRNYAKDSYIMRAGDAASRIGIVLKGYANVVREDIFGNRSILSSLETGDMFAESFVCAGVEEMPVHVEAQTACTVLLLNYTKVITTCETACVYHQKVIENMMQILANKNIQLNQKLEVVSARTTREKLMNYFLEQASKSDNKAFNIPFDRQQLADYLGVDRSAMSSELGKLRDDGVLEFYKNSFKLLSV